MDTELAYPVEIYLYCVPLVCGGYVYEGVTADSGSGELSEESAVKRLFCAKAGEGREKASCVEERTFRFPWTEAFEENREMNQAMG
jgi:hypothetical protein